MTDSISLDDLPQPEWEGTVPPDDLSVDGDNPNEQSEEMFGLLCENLRTHGWLGNAIIVDEDYTIADGEHRWRAAQEIGLDEVPIKVYAIDEPTRRLWRQELNKISGEHDTKRDALEYDYLLEHGKGEDIHALTQAAGEDLDELLAAITLGREQRVPYEYDAAHTIYFEDCVEGLRDRVDDASIDCVLTDPPYGIDVDLEETLGATTAVSHTGVVENDGFEEAVALFQDVAAELSRVLVPDGHIYVFASWKTYDLFRDILSNHGFPVRNCLVWTKSNVNNQPHLGSEGRYYGTRHEFVLFAGGDGARPLRRLESDVQHHPMSVEGLTHPTQKPLSLIETLLTNSTRKGETILDPFMGSGTTAVAAIQNDREYIGFEIDEENYRSVIERRISEAKRQLATSRNATAEGE